MSVRRRILGRGQDVAGTGTGIPGVGVPWKNVDVSGKPRLETGDFQVPFKPAIFSSLLARTSGPPAVGAPWKTEDPYGKPMLESEGFETETEGLLQMLRRRIRGPMPVVEPPFHGRFGAGEELQVERKDVAPSKAARYESFQGVAAKPLETELVGRKMPVREAKLRRTIRDRTRAQSRIAKLRDSPRIQSLKQTQFEMEKFTKDQAFYVDHSIYPFLTCQNCIWFLPGNPNAFLPDRCVVVSEKGGSGTINPEGTSTGFNASPARLKLIERAYGRGEGKRGVLPQAIRSRLMPIGKKFVYPDTSTETA